MAQRTPVLDHVAVVAPDLATGLAWVCGCLGVDMPPGGKHREMGTHNHLLRLGDDQFLEVIAVDPDAPSPGRPRWFGLDDRAAIAADWASGRRLRSMVARTTALNATLALDPALGTAETMSRGERVWRFGVRPNGALPLDGALPCLMDWGPAGTPAPNMADLGCSMVDLVLETPDPVAVTARHAALGLVRGPVVRPGPRTKLIAAIETPRGVRILT